MFDYGAVAALLRSIKYPGVSGLVQGVTFESSVYPTKEASSSPQPRASPIKNQTLQPPANEYGLDLLSCSGWL
jgi:hypothetical protein